MSEKSPVAYEDTSRREKKKNLINNTIYLALHYFLSGFDCLAEGCESFLAHMYRIDHRRRLYYTVDGLTS